MAKVSPVQTRGMFASRMATTLLRALGGGEVRLLLPSPVDGDDTAQQLGVAAAALQEAALTPVLVRNYSTEDPPTVRYELLVGAETLQPLVEGLCAASVEALLATTHGVMLGTRRLHIVSVTPEYFATIPYLYRILASE